MEKVNHSLWGDRGPYPAIPYQSVHWLVGALTSSFTVLICKHLLFFYEPILNPVRFFREVRRQRFPPFWIDKSDLRPEYRPTGSPRLSSRRRYTSKDPNSEIDADSSCSDTEEDFDPEAVNEDHWFPISRGYRPCTNNINQLLLSRTRKMTRLMR